MTAKNLPETQTNISTNRGAASNPVRSMTGFARIAGTAPNGNEIVLTLKSVNHRYLDLQFHLPNGFDALEMRWRRALKERLIRGHIDVRLVLANPSASGAAQFNPDMVRAYVNAFRAASAEHDLPGKPDLNVALQLPGVWPNDTNGVAPEASAFEDSADLILSAAIDSLNVMRSQEGAILAEELRRTLTRLQAQVDELAGLRADMQRACAERLDQKMREILGGTAVPPERIAMEAALLAERSDVEEEIARLRAHIGHFHDLLDQGGELGKKLDFLLQEMTREANTTLSKTGGIANRSLRITELGLAMKAEIEKAREQVQNLE